MKAPLVTLALRNGLLAGLLVLIFSVLTLPRDPLAQAAEEIPPPVIDVVIEQGLLTVDVRNAPCADILRVIADRAGLGVIIRGDVSSPVTESFTGVPLDEGIKKLVRRHSVALVYAASPNVAEVESLTGIWVIGASLTGQAPAEPYPAHGRPPLAAISQSRAR